MRRPRAGFVTPSPGGPGQPSAGITTGCLRWLDAAATKGGGSCPDRGSGSGPVAARKHGARDRKAACGAPRGATPSERRRAHKKWPRRSARHPLSRFERGKRQGEYGRTRRPTKNTGGGAMRVTPKSGNRFSDQVTRKRKRCLTVESVRTGAINTLRSSPRKRGLSSLATKYWMPAFAGTNGEGITSPRAPAPACRRASRGCPRRCRGNRRRSSAC